METVSSGIFVHDVISTYKLTEYANSLIKTTGVSIQFSDITKRLGVGALLDSHRKVIYLPRLDYSKNFDLSHQFRKIKALLNHECAHLLFPDESYFGKFPDRYSMTFDECYYMIIYRDYAHILDDLRIEYHLSKEYPDVKEDFKFLIDTVWAEYVEFSWERAIANPVDCGPGKGLNGDYSNSVRESLYWALQRHYRNASLVIPDSDKMCQFVPDFDKFFDGQVVPLIDDYIQTLDLTSYDTARELVALIKNYYPHVFEEELRQLRQMKTRAGNNPKASACTLRYNKKF